MRKVLNNPHPKCYFLGRRNKRRWILNSPVCSFNYDWLAEEDSVVNTPIAIYLIELPTSKCILTSSMRRHSGLC